MNTHGIPDTLAELESIHYDLLPTCITATSGLTTPGSGLTLAAVSAKGYVRRGTDLLYVEQPAVAVTVSGTAGQHWLALTVDTHTSYAGWTRRAGSHFIEQANAATPPTPDGALLIAFLTVTGANITAVTVATSPPLSRQNANAVAIVGGTISLLANASPGAYLVNNDAAATAQIGFRSIVSAGTGKYNVLADGTAQNAFTGNVGCGNATPTYPLDVTGQARVTGTLGVGVAPSASYNLYLSRNKASVHGIVFQPTGSDTATNELMFLNVAGSIVGSIQSTAAATSYNTSSDKRLKEAITALPDALATIQRLLPVQFRWKSTGEVAQGFLAQDVQPLVPQAVTGDPADPTPNMQMDLSKLVPYLTGACQELAAQVQALTARVADLEAALA